MKAYVQTDIPQLKVSQSALSVRLAITAQAVIKLLAANIGGLLLEPPRAQSHQLATVMTQRNSQLEQCVVLDTMPILAPVTLAQFALKVLTALTRQQLMLAAPLGTALKDQLTTQHTPALLGTTAQTTKFVTMASIFPQTKLLVSLAQQDKSVMVDSRPTTLLSTQQVVTTPLSVSQSNSFALLASRAPPM